MTQRDASGRFVRATPAEKVAAHVEKVNERHQAVQEWARRVADEWRTDQLAQIRAEMEAETKPGGAYRTQPLEYDDEPWPVWLWLGIGTVVLVLGVAIWVMTH